MSTTPIIDSLGIYRKAAVSVLTQSATAEWLYEYTKNMPRRNITTAGDLYMVRYTMAEYDSGHHMYLHQIKRPDLALELHDHPWAFDAVILSGGYIEQRWQNGGRVSIIRQPGTSYHCDDTTYHRIAELLTPECWTLVVTALKSKSWSFMMPETNVVTPWREFVATADRHIEARKTTPPD